MTLQVTVGSTARLAPVADVDSLPWPTSRCRPPPPSLASGPEAAARLRRGRQRVDDPDGRRAGRHRRTLPRDRRRVRQGAQGVRRAHRVVPGRLPRFGRRRHRARRGHAAGPGSGLVGRGRARAHARAGPARLRVLRRGGPGGQLPQPALSRRLRLHGRVRHPALLSPGPGVAGAVRRTGRRLRDGRRPPPVPPRTARRTADGGA